MNRLFVLCLSSASILLVAGCSTLNPKNANPDCGGSINFQEVRIVDLTSYRNPQSQMDSVLRQMYGSYTLATDKPVQVPRDFAYWNAARDGGLAGVKAEVADWGCNLLVLMEVKAARAGVGVQARNEEKVWMIHVGTGRDPR